MDDQSEWPAIAAWLKAQPRGAELLAVLASASGLGQLPDRAVEQLTNLSVRGDAPSALTANVAGGNIGKLVQIARADTVNVLLGGAAAPVPAQLPPPPANFVDREDELTRLREALASSGAGGRIFTLSGGAGVGKSALAVLFAVEVIERFPDGQLYADLRGADDEPVDPAVVLDRFLGSLGVPGDQLPNSLEERQALYRSLLAGRRALILLDNAGGDGQIRLLSPGGPDCLVIVTSRRPLMELEAAEQESLDVLAPRHSLELLGRLAGNARITAERDDALAVAEFCGHLPLALRIAGARLRSRPTWRIAELAGRMRDEKRRLDELTLGDHAVRSSFLISHRELSAAQARAVRLWGLIPGPDFGPRVAAAALGGDGEAAAEALAEALVDAALLQTRSPGRYRFHDLLGILAREQAEGLDVSERRAAVDRIIAVHRDDADAWYRRALGDYEPHPEALAWFEVEGPNVLAAAEAAFDLGTWSTVIALAAALHHLLAWLGRARELRRLFRLAVTAAERSGDAVAELNAAIHLAELLLWAGRSDETRPLYARARQIADELGDPAQRLWVLTHLGDAMRDWGEQERAQEVYAEALGLARESGDVEKEAWVTVHSADGRRDMGHADAALELFERALAVGRERGDTGNQAWILPQMALALEALGRPEEADAALREALAIMRANSVSAGSVGVEWVVGRWVAVLLERRDWAGAREAYSIAEESAGARGDEFAVRKWSGLAEWARGQAAP